MNNPNADDRPAEQGGESPGDEPRSLLWTITAGALWSLASAFPITALLGLCFRFPVPFDGIEGGPSHVLPSLSALLFFGVCMGGFVVVAICGGLAGAIAWSLAPAAAERRLLQPCLSIGVTFVLLFVLATLDWYIGPW